MYTYMILMTLLYLPFAYPQGLPGPCIIQCANQAIAAGSCASLADLNCICTSVPYQQAVTGCLQANCTAADLQMAMGIQAQECGATSGSASSGATSAPTSSGSSTPTGTSTSILTNPSGTGGGTTTPTQTGTGIPSTSSGPSGTGTGTGTGTGGATSDGTSASQTQSPNTAPSFGGTLIFMHDIIAICVVWIGIIVGGALVL